MIIAITVGVGFGIFRYWFGFFVLIQGVLGASIVSWLLSRTSPGRTQLCQHPGSMRSLGYAFMLSLTFVIGEILGIGLSQAWFDPLGWMTRILQGDTAESLFGIAYTGTIAHSIDSHAEKSLWVVLNVIDLTFMLFFFWILPWIHGEKSVQS